MATERLDKIISSQTPLSRKDASKRIREGSLTVNGVVITAPDFKADPQTDIIIFEGQTLFYKKYIYIMMNKPKGVVSASTDKRVKTVVDLVPEKYRRENLFPAGRLDKDTTGFILITDNGDFAHEILSPKNHIYKTYEAVLKNSITQAEKEILENGITLKDGTKYMPCKIKVLEEENNLVEIKIREGKFHQIKKMFIFINNEVVELKRTQLGNLTIDLALDDGCCRLISTNELKLIRDFDQ